MKKIILILSMVFVLTSCAPAETQTDICDEFPDHSSCVVVECEDDEELVDGVCEDIVDPNDTGDVKLVNEAKEALVLDLSDLDNIVYPTTGLNNAIITWESSNESVYNIDGEVYSFPTAIDVTVIATISLNEVSVEKEFSITLPAISNLSTIEEVKAATINDEATVYGMVVGIETDGFFVNDDDQSMFVKSTSTVELGQIVLIKGTLQFEDVTNYFLNQTDITVYQLDAREITHDDKVKMGIYTSMDITDAANHGLIVHTEGVIKVENDEIIIFDGTVSLKLSGTALENIKQEFKENEYYKVDFVGVTRYFDGTYWNVNVSSLDLVEFNDLNESEKLFEIVKWVKSNVPNVIDDTIEEIDLPTTHPVYGGKIKWGLTETEGLISETGKVSYPVVDRNIEVSFSVEFEGTTYASFEIIYIVMEGTSLDISDLMNETVYNEAKENWNLSGKYDYDGLYNVTGIVLFNFGSTIYLRDVETDDFIKVITNGSFNDGDIVTLEGLSLRTRDYRPELVGGVVKLIETGTPVDVTKVVMTNQEVDQLDKKSLSTYNMLIEISKVFSCYDIFGERNVYTEELRPFCGVDEHVDSDFISSSWFSSWQNVYVDLELLVVGHDNANGGSKIIKEIKVSKPEYTIQDKIDLVYNHMKFLMGHGINFVSMPKQLHTDSTTVYFSTVPTDIYASVDFEFSCDPVEFCTDTMLPRVTDDSGNDITPGHAYLIDGETKYAINIIPEAIGGSEFKVTVTMTYTLEDENGNAIADPITLTEEFTIVPGKTKPTPKK